MASKQIVVIGSGFGGLSAAIRLAAQGHAVTILEQRDRPGGRAYVYQTKGYTFDSGPTVITAPFMFDELWQLAGKRREDYFTLEPCRPYYRLFNHEGRYLEYGDDEQALLDQIRQWNPADVEGYQRFIASTRPIFEKGFGLIDKPFLHFGDMLRVAPDLIRLKSHQSVYRFVSQFFQIEGADLNRLSAAALARERRLSTIGEDNFHIDCGYRHLLAPLSAGLAIELEAAVTLVRWDAQQVAVELADGRQFRARQLVITVPVSLLQAGQPAFDPPLPAAKQAALAAIPMGHVTKLALWFDRQCWPEFTVLSTDGVIATWWPVTSARVPTLMGYMGGRQALAVADLGEAEAIVTALRELSALFSVDAAAAYRAGRLVDWSRDPWSRGAYTYSAAGTPAARVALAEPVGPLFFAGEATVTGAEIATVHGALESGRRVARAILLRNHQIQTHL
ncbi:hypothetical protein A6A03_18765 [Chloroflexus islandicus]|uniref:Amine oxidase domain-containing protein n=1 Tax=Chloroflexus islandicus TaxID=1707952 RepID=A0A178M254_9CHLR|nr:NAD(P)/FAD-dependent oxidoreductase [Chloroflexus islandicus]OAN42148.1 hypothetical protein A6A03_18765 [Chloroflexus islandicus]